MAQKKLSRKENVIGDFFVDTTCIDCDTCRWLAPESFDRIGEMSAVGFQPQTDEQKLQAAQALLSCPTASIGYEGNELDMVQIASEFPILVEDNVYYCGFSSEKSYGASSYFVKHENANILIDCPSFAKPLVDSLEKLGGVDYMLLTHKDDVAEHQKFKDHFDLKRLIHKTELCNSILEAEILYEVSHPGVIDQSLDDLTIIPTPGHTEGHLCFLYKNKFLFSGDHIAYSKQRNQIRAFENHCWYSWDKTLESVEKLITYNFEWILPGHGRRIKSTPGRFKLALEEYCLDQKNS